MKILKYSLFKNIPNFIFILTIISFIIVQVYIN
jgi:hypothetical protein